jgi:hypothetical protein
MKQYLIYRLCRACGLGLCTSHRLARKVVRA